MEDQRQIRESLPSPTTLGDESSYQLGRPLFPSQRDDQERKLGSLRDGRRHAPVPAVSRRPSLLSLSPLPTMYTTLPYIRVYTTPSIVDISTLISHPPRTAVMHVSITSSTQRHRDILPSSHPFYSRTIHTKCLTQVLMSHFGSTPKPIYHAHLTDFCGSDERVGNRGTEPLFRSLASIYGFVAKRKQSKSKQDWEATRAIPRPVTRSSFLGHHADARRSRAQLAGMPLDVFIRGSRQHDLNSSRTDHSNRSESDICRVQNTPTEKIGGAASGEEIRGALYNDRM